MPDGSQSIHATAGKVHTIGSYFFCECQFVGRCMYVRMYVNYMKKESNIFHSKFFVIQF